MTGVTAREYFTAFLEGLRLPVTLDNLLALYGVATREGWNDRYNPLNVIQPEPGSTNYNSVGVQAYADFETGVRGAVTLFQGPHWAGVRSALAKEGSTASVLAAFAAAYTWAPGITFSPGRLADGDRIIGPVGPPTQEAPLTAAEIQEVAEKAAERARELIINGPLDGIQGHLSLASFLHSIAATVHTLETQVAALVNK